MKAIATTRPGCTREEEQQFRNQATGIGQTRSASERTGAMRSQRVIDAAPPAQRRVADDSYPDPIPDAPIGGALSAGYTAAQGPLRRAFRG